MNYASKSTEEILAGPFYTTQEHELSVEIVRLRGQATKQAGLIAAQQHALEKLALWVRNEHGVLPAAQWQYDLALKILADGEKATVAYDAELTERIERHLLYTVTQAILPRSEVNAALPDQWNKVLEVERHLAPSLEKRDKWIKGSK